jgi:hypothetical protein
MNARTIRSTFLMLGLSVSLGLGLEHNYGQQQPDGATVKGQQSRDAIGGTDNNIKHGRQLNDRDATTLEAPPQKGGPKTRGPSCRIHIDNRTPWYVDIYTDGDYRGQVSSWGDSYGGSTGGTRTCTESPHSAMARMSHSARRFTA